MLPRLCPCPGRRQHNPFSRGNALTRRNAVMAMSITISHQQQPNQLIKAMSKSFHATSYISTSKLTHLSGLAIEAPYLFKGIIKPTKVSHTPRSSISSDVSQKSSDYLAVKFAGGKVIYCQLKPLVNFHEDDLSKKLEKGWCALCDLKPVDPSVEQRGEGVLDGKLIGAVEWDGERFKSILEEHLYMKKIINKESSFKSLQQNLGGKETQEGVVKVAEELALLEQQRLELEELVVKKVNFLEWATLFGLAAVMGTFIRLTWWDWDWDAVEPFSFVFMYSLLIAGYAYFVLTKRDLTYQGARRRVKNMLFTREAQRKDFSLQRYKELVKNVKKSL